MQPQPQQQGVGGDWQPGTTHRAIPHPSIAARMHPQELALMQQLVRLQQENAALRGYAERVTKELRSARLSQAVAAAAASAGGDAPLRAPALAAELQHQAEALPLPPWCLNMQLVSPLLAAYDERILELQEEAKEKERVIEGFSAKVAGVTRENEQLAEELRSKTARLHQLFEAEAGGALGGNGGGKTYNSLLQERNELEELYTLTSEQSEVLLSQNHLLKCHVQQSEAALEDMRVMMAETERRAAAVAAKEEALTKQEDTVAKQALQLQEVEEQKNELSRKLALAEKETERLSVSLADAVKQQEVLQRELHRERTGAETAASLQKELDALKQQTEAAVRETAAAKEVADYLEERLSAQTRETEEARKQAENTTQQLHAAVVEKEKAVASAALLQHHLDQLRGQHEAEIQILRTAQGDTLEKRALQAEEVADKLRLQMEALQRAHGEAMVKLETAERRAAAASADAEQARNELSSSAKHHRTVQQHQQQAQAAAEAEVARLKESLNAQSKDAASKAAALTASKRQLEDSLAAAETGRLALQQEHALLQQKCDQLQETCNTQQQQLADAAARLATTEAERDAAKRRADRETADAKRRFESLTALAEAKAARIQEAADRRQTAAAQRLMEEQQRQERLRRESEDQRQRLQQQLAKAVAANAALRQKVNELLNGLDKALLPESLLDDEVESDGSP
ncbi:non-muscle myosin II heavy chain, putative [Eimeria acervulina]|uniref:Non-muscle myosin II heavy chain, putative n=1 Tax=Eimeria acervulina TaxID=5801 RepID=U6GSH9_EIMAC|nr:non-muscle myosin II heavy chain, putative [Eimeria acervulina]CDI82243.1 non-muscle myosin II heavy chain, putative [Eimeria acervulina]